MLKDDIPAFGLFLIRQIFAKTVSDREWDVFVGKFPQSDTYSIEYTWIPNVQIASFKSLLSALPSLSSKASFENAEFWKEWVTSEEPEKSFTDILSKKLS
jgi:hypothetical protein